MHILALKARLTGLSVLSKVNRSNNAGAAFKLAVCVNPCTQPTPPSPWNGKNRGLYFRPIGDIGCRHFVECPHVSGRPASNSAHVGSRASAAACTAFLRLPSNPLPPQSIALWRVKNGYACMARLHGASWPQRFERI